MERITFIDDWQGIFQSAHLVTFDDFFHYTGGGIINKNSRRQVRVFSLTHNNRTHSFFMKCFFKVHLKDKLFTWKNFHRPTSQAHAEFDNARTLIENGIDTYHPVAFGEILAAGLEKQSFFITRKMNHQCLKDFMIERWPGLSTEQQMDLISQLARFIRRIHGAHIHLPDLYSYHIYVTPPANGGNYQWAVIDLHRMQSRVRSRQKFARDLAALFFSIPESYLTDGLKQQFFDEYTSGRSGDITSLQKQVGQRVNVLAERRSPPKWD